MVAATAEAPPQGLGVKASLFELLRPLEQPITAEDLWPLAEVRLAVRDHKLQSQRFLLGLQHATHCMSQYPQSAAGIYSCAALISMTYAQAKGLRSKRFMKDLLNDMRKSGKVTSKPARGKSFGYILPENYLKLKNRVRKAQPTEPNPPKARSAV